MDLQGFTWLKMDLHDFTFTFKVMNLYLHILQISFKFSFTST
jgi:hypothetical protein